MLPSYQLARIKLARRWRCIRFRVRFVISCIIVLSCVVVISMTSSPQPPSSSPPPPPSLKTPHRKYTERTNQLSPLLENFTVKMRRPILGMHIAGKVYGDHSPAETCPKTTPSVNDSRVLPENMEETFKWQQLVPDSSAVYLFAAYFDRRWWPTPAVIVIGLSEYSARTNSVPKYCRLWYRNDVTIKAHVAPVHGRYSDENHGLRYSPSFYTCFVRDNDVIPFAVSLVNDPCDTSPPHNILKVMTSSDYDDDSPVNFTVCVTPFNYRYDNVRQLVEMIEVNRMLGAQHFVFYNYSSGPNVTRYLNDFYRKYQDTVTVIPWPLPMPVDVWPPDAKVTPEVHYFGQVAALNDCLYRCIVRRSTFTVFTDLDEIIVPRRRDSWSAMLDDVTVHWQRTKQLKDNSLFPGIYLIRNTFFRTDWTRDRMFAERGDEYQLLDTLSTTEREEKIFEWMLRSKYITWSDAALTVGVHMVDDAAPGVDTVFVDVPDALVHHYRQWKGLDDPVNPPSRVTDRYMHRYADVISQRTAGVHQFMERT